MTLRSDFQIIADLIPRDSRILDLGCGHGELLAHLKASKNVNGYGIEIDPIGIMSCIKSGVNVIEQNLDEGLQNFQSNSFDTVVMTDTLQSVKRPDLLLEEMLRIGKQCIITYPNFGHWRLRTYLVMRGKMPIAPYLPYSWYDTPNIHLCTFADFENLCSELTFSIKERFVTDSNYRNRFLINRMPNLFGTYAFYCLGKPCE